MTADREGASVPEGWVHVGDLCEARHGGVYVPQAHAVEPVHMRPMGIGHDCGTHGRRFIVPMYAATTGPKSDDEAGLREACGSFTAGVSSAYGEFCGTCGLSDMDHVPFDDMIDRLIDQEADRG